MRVLLFHDGLVGTRQRAVELGRRLDRSGHRLTIATPTEWDLPDDAPVELVRLGERDGIVDRRDELPRPSSQHRSPAGAARWVSASLRARRASIRCDELEAVIERTDPVAVLVDLEFHLAGLAARGSGRPAALVSGLMALWETPTTPPLHTPLGPGDPEAVAAAWRTCRHEAARYRRRQWCSPSGVATLLRPFRSMTNNAPDIAAFARHREMRLGAVTDGDRWVRPFLVSGLPLFVWNSAAMDFPHEPPADVRYLGPMVPARATPVSRRTDGRTGVYVSTGSYWSGGSGLLGRVIAAAGRRPDWDVVVGLGDRYDRAGFGDVPDNVELIDWAPQRELLEWADVAILHGGITSIVEATLAGTPMVCFSTGTNDQDGHVARVVHHGLGRAGDRRADDATAIAAHVDAALAAGPRRRVEAMRRTLLADVDSGAAIDAVEALATGRDRPVRGS